MRIQLELNPELMERLGAEAQARGIGLEEYAGLLLREAIATRVEPQGQLSVAELRAMLNAIAEGSEKLPKVPTSAFSRESFYEDRRWNGSTPYVIDSNIVIRWVQPSDPDNAKSLMDYIARWLELRFLTGWQGELFKVLPISVQPAIANSSDPVGALGELIQMGDAPACNICGSLMVRNGSCYRCMTCGGTSGCS